MAARGHLLGLADSTAQPAMLGQHSSSLGLQGHQPVQHGTPYQLQFSALLEPFGTGSSSGVQAAPAGMPAPVAVGAPGLLPVGRAEVQLAPLAGGAADAGNLDPYNAQLAQGADQAAAGKWCRSTPFVAVSHAIGAPHEQYSCSPRGMHVSHGLLHLVPLHISTTTACTEHAEFCLLLQRPPPQCSPLTQQSKTRCPHPQHEAAATAVTQSAATTQRQQLLLMQPQQQELQAPAQLALSMLAPHPLPAQRLQAALTLCPVLAAAARTTPSLRH
jgi:hypothetical protein